MATGKLSSAAVLRLPAGPLAAHPDRSLDEWALLCRVDGRRPLATVAGGHGLAEVVAVAERLLAAGLIEHVADAEPGPDGDPASGAEPDVDDAEPGTWAGLADEDDLTASAGPDLPDGHAVPEPVRPPAAGTSGAEAEEARIDSVSLLRELASESGAAPRPDDPGADDAWQELATRLAGGQEEDATVASESEETETTPPDGQPNRPPGRPGDQAAFMREFASLATDDDADQPDAPPTPESDGEQPDDRARGGRFGFRKGQRR